MLILIGQLWVFVCMQLLLTLTGVLENIAEILVWFSSSQCTHTQFSVVQIETFAMQTSSLFKMSLGAVAKASLLCQLQSWLNRLLRSCLKCGFCLEAQSTPWLAAPTRSSSWHKRCTCEGPVQRLTRELCREKEQVTSVQMSLPRWN